MKTLKKLKVLKSGLLSPYKNFRYELGKWYTCYDFDPDLEKDCAKGFHATDIEGLPYAWNTTRECYEAEVGGKSVIYDIYKQRFEKQRIIRKVEKNELISLAKAKEPELGYLLSEILYPLNPLSLNRTEVTEEEKALLSLWIEIWKSFGEYIWASVEASVETPVKASVRVSVWESIWESIWMSIEPFVEEFVAVSVWTSVGTSIGAYTSSLFPNVKKWEGIEHKEGENPFQPGADLWRRGLIPSYNGKVWKLHGGKDAKVLYELKI